MGVAGGDEGKAAPDGRVGVRGARDVRFRLEEHDKFTVIHFELDSPFVRGEVESLWLWRKVGSLREEEVREILQLSSLPRWRVMRAWEEAKRKWFLLAKQRRSAKRLTPDALKNFHLFWVALCV